LLLGVLERSTRADVSRPAVGLADRRGGGERKRGRRATRPASRVRMRVGLDDILRCAYVLGMPNLEQRFNDDKRATFLEWYAKTGRVGESAKAAGVHNCTVLEHRKKDPDFDQACKEAYDLYRESLEQEIERRGKEGVLDPIFQSGILVGHKRVYSDTLMLAHARRHIPEYREKHSVDVNHSGGVLVVPGVAKDSYEWEEDGGDQRNEETG
jgi:hypothetical protein